jgi:branched-chain amino acid transport system substrate-binding protein
LGSNESLVTEVEPLDSSYEKLIQEAREKALLSKLESLQQQIDSLQLHIKVDIDRKNELETNLRNQDDPRRKGEFNKAIEDIKEILHRHTEELDTLLKELELISQNDINEEIDLAEQLRDTLNKEVDPNQKSELNQALEETTKHLQHNEEKRDRLRESIFSLKKNLDAEIAKPPTRKFLLPLILLLMLIVSGLLSIRPGQNELLTSEDIENLRSQISVGERILATHEGDERKNEADFRDAKQKGTKAIFDGNYEDAIEALESTRLESNPGFYKNAPETLTYLNNAEIGKEQSYTIAVATPLTNDSENNYSLGVLRGVALAQQEINEKGGIKDSNIVHHPLRIVVVDDQNNPTNENLATFLSDPSLTNSNQELKILGLIGHQTSDLTLALGDIYQKAGLPVVSPSATSQEIFGRYSYVHPVSPSTNQMADRLTRKIKEEEEWKQVIVFYDPNEEYSRSFGTEVCTEIGESCELRDLNERPVTDVGLLENEISRISTENALTTLVIAFNPDKSPKNEKTASRIIEAVSKLNKTSQNKIKIFAGNALYDQNLLDTAAREVTINRVSPWDRGLSVNSENLESETIETIENNNKVFLSENEKTWGTDQINWYTLMAYNATMALVEAIEESKLPAPNGIKIEELKETRKKINNQFISGNFTASGALGDIVFTKEGYVGEGNFLCLSILEGSSTPQTTNCESSDSVPVKNPWFAHLSRWFDKTQ